MANILFMMGRRKRQPSTSKEIAIRIITLIAIAGAFTYVLAITVGAIAALIIACFGAVIVAVPIDWSQFRLWRR